MSPRPLANTNSSCPTKATTAPCLLQLWLFCQSSASPKHPGIQSPTALAPSFSTVYPWYTVPKGSSGPHTLLLQPSCQWAPECAHFSFSQSSRIALTWSVLGNPTCPHYSSTNLPVSWGLHREHSYIRPLLQSWDRVLFCLIHRNEQKFNPNEETDTYAQNKRIRQNRVKHSTW